MFLQVRFNDFTNEESFINLQNKFIKFDYNRGPLDQVGFKTIIKNDFDIVYYNEDNDHYQRIWFYKDFLHKKVRGSAKETINKIKNVISNNYKYDTLKREQYLNVTIGDFHDIENNIIKSNILNKSIKIEIIKQIRIVLNYIQHLLKDFECSDKILFNLNSNDVLTLFHLLRKNGNLNHPYDNKVGRLIEKYFMYKREENGEYHQFKKAGKVLNDIKNGNKSIEGSLNKLKSIFQNENFYNI